MATIQVLYGAEHGSTAGLIIGNTTNKIFDSATGTLGTQILVAAAAARNGGYGLRISGANTFVRWDTSTLGASKTSLLGTMWWQASTDPSGLKEVLVFDLAGGGTDFSAIDYSPTTNKLQAFIGGSMNSSTPTINPGTWYLIQWLYTISGATNTFDWSIDGVDEPQITDGHGADTFAGVCFGDRSSGTTGASDFDDIVVSTTAADYPLGQHKVVQLGVDPAGTVTVSGTTTNFNTFAGATPTLSAWNATTARDSVDEVPPNIGSSQDGWCQVNTAATDYVEMPLTSYTLTAAETVSGARMLACLWAQDATAGTFGLRTYNGTTERTLFAAADPNTDNSATAPAWVCKMLTTADVDTQAELDALTIRGGFSGDAAPDIGLHAVYVELAIKEGANPTPAAITATATVGVAAVATGQTVTPAAIGVAATVPAPAVATTGQILTAVAAGGNWSSAATWSPAQTPTPADRCILDATSGNVTINTAAFARSLDCTGYTGTLTHNAATTLSIGDGTVGFGNMALKFSAAMTYTKVNATTSAISFVSTAPTQQSITCAGKTLGNVIFNGAGGSWLFADAFAGAGSVVLTAGALDTGGVACTSASFASSNTNVRALTLGATTWTVTGAAGTIWSTSTATNLTLSAASSTIVYGASASTRNFAGGGEVYGNFVYTAAGSTGTLGINTSATVNNFSFSDASNARTLRLTAGVTLTVLGVFYVNGTPGNLMTIDSLTPGSDGFLVKASGIVSCDYLSIRDSDASGGAQWYAGANSTDVAGNAGWIFTAPPPPTSILATTTMPAPVVAGSGVATPAAITATATLPTPSTSGSATVTPAAITATTAVEGPTVAGAATATPAAITATAVVSGTVLSALIPAAITATATVPAPSVATSATAGPASLIATATVGPATAAGAAAATPAAISVTTTVGAATVATGQAATPDAVITATTVGAPTTTGGATATPAAVAAATSVGVAAVATGQTVTPAAIATATTVSGTVVSAITPTLIATTTTIGVPTVAAAVTATPAVILTTTTVSAPTVSASGAATPAVITATATVGVTAVIAVTTVSPASILVVASVAAGLTGEIHATETDSAQPVIAIKRLALGQADESDTVTAVNPQRGAAVNTATEVDTAQAMDSGAGALVPTATETDVALPLWAGKGALLGSPAETDLAQPLSVGRGWTLGQAVEVDFPWPIPGGELPSVDVDDLVQGAVKFLTTKTDVTAVLGSYEDTEVPWLFQHTLWVNVEGSSSTAAVVSRAGGWAGPNQYNTMEFPRLQVEIYVDPHRDSYRNVTDPGEARRRIYAAFQVIDRHMHIVANADQFWGSVRVIGSTRLGEPTIYPVPDGGGLLRLVVLYGVVEAGIAVAG